MWTRICGPVQKTLLYRPPPLGGGSAPSCLCSAAQEGPERDGGSTMAAPDGEMNHGTDQLEFSLDVPFPSSPEALIALRSLSPDREPRKGGISKQLSVSGSTLSVRWSADEARILRVSVNSFLDHLSLVIETMEMFGPPVSVSQ